MGSRYERGHVSRSEWARMCSPAFIEDSGVVMPSIPYNNQPYPGDVEKDKRRKQLREFIKLFALCANDETINDDARRHAYECCVDFAKELKKLGGTVWVIDRNGREAPLHKGLD